MSWFKSPDHIEPVDIPTGPWLPFGPSPAEIREDIKLAASLAGSHSCKNVREAAQEACIMLLRIMAMRANAVTIDTNRSDP